jgi:hypothetical protein
MSTTTMKAILMYAAHRKIMGILPTLMYIGAKFQVGANDIITLVWHHNTQIVCT